MKSYYKLPILLAMVSLLFVGCNDNPANKGDTAKNNPKQLLKLVNDLDDRRVDLTNNSNNKIALSGSNYTTAIGFEAKEQILPPNVNNPGGTIGARTLDIFDNGTDRRVYVGYKIVNKPATGPASNVRGGGVDILNANNPSDFTRTTSNNSSLQSDVLDIQGIANYNNTLYLAASAEEGENTLVNAAVLISVSLESDGDPSVSNGNAQTDFADVAGNLLKDVTVGPEPGNSAYQVYAVNDETSVFAFPESDINSYATYTEPGANFRSIASAKFNNLYTHSTNNLYQVEANNGRITDATNALPQYSGNSTIVDIAVHQFPNYSDEMILVAGNEEGFSVSNNHNLEGEIKVRYKDNPNGTGTITSITASDDYVYVSAGSQIWVYEVRSSGLDNTNPSEGLLLLGSFNIEQVDYNNNVDAGPTNIDGQINKLLAFQANGSNYLYIAKSEDGVIILEQKNGTLFN